MSDNPFARPGAAARYAAGRPDFHATVIERARRHVAPTGRLARALDIACGTGQSTRALRAIADTAIRLDASTAMLREADDTAGAHYVAAAAEALPFAADSFDLVSVALALHWFDRRRFLAAVGRVLRPGGWLIVYDCGFRGEMIGQRRFRDWAQAYYARYPGPPRAGGGISVKQAARAGLVVHHDETHATDIVMTRDAFVAYLTSQSNAIAAADRAGGAFAAIEQWIRDSVDHFFADGPQTLRFGGTIEYLRKRD
ncbi:class I SAM-dependent methyltransferase [Salinisphaera sp. LB1]|uniref:class I SAM-dependent methyltransferase n=1 Tax=Salinisphaera sp. LB1 TaxID=2183911 RepID=UPI000D7070AA|nr:class I SAM-dependent methyltransferase [Salinisphaera sp. LB1]AWN16085.1 SAM-dependent methyltransferase [Salinisphaera sp. LB1]